MPILWNLNHTFLIYKFEFHIGGPLQTITYTPRHTLAQAFFAGHLISGKNRPKWGAVVEFESYISGN